jgi:anti-sigma factor RsiW
MNCSHVRNQLRALLDGECAEALRASLQSHLSICETCRGEAETIVAFERRMRDALQAEPVPSALLARLRSQADHRRPRHSIRGIDSRVARRLALLGALALILLFPPASVIRLRQEPPEGRLEVAETPINELRTFIDSHRPLDVTTSDSDELRMWFAGKVLFSPPPSPLLPNLHLIGGRLCFFMNRRIAAYMYRSDDHLLSLYIIPSLGQKAARDGADRLYMADRTADIRTLDGLTNVAWERDDLVYALVSDMPEPAIVQLAGEFHR